MAGHYAPAAIAVAEPRRAQTAVLAGWAKATVILVWIAQATSCAEPITAEALTHAAAISRHYALLMMIVARTRRAQTAVRAEWAKGTVILVWIVQATSFAETITAEALTHAAVMARHYALVMMIVAPRRTTVRHGTTIAASVFCTMTPQD
jgi:hypothetical protein